MSFGECVVLLTASYASLEARQTHTGARRETGYTTIGTLDADWVLYHSHPPLA